MTWAKMAAARWRPAGGRRDGRAPP